MKLAVISHKACWLCESSPTGYATDGGFPFQMCALSQLFDETRLIVPCASQNKAEGEIHLTGNNLSVVPLSVPKGSDLKRKLQFPFWLAVNFPKIFREVWRADAVHAAIPGDVGTIGMLLAYLLRKPLFVRHCGNWLVQATSAERFWIWFMEKAAGGRNVMLATGGSAAPPSKRNENIRWIFSTSLTNNELSLYAAKREQKPLDRVRLIITCRQEMEKGTGVVIESLPLILKEFPNTTLDVVGDGIALDEFRQLSEQTRQSNRVTFHGKVNHETVLALLKQADIFCYPTRASEGFPKAVLEALACGLPVVTTRVSVLPQLIENGCGVLIDKATPKALAVGVREVLTSDEGYAKMSLRAVETARQFSLESWRDSIGALLREAWSPLFGGTEVLNVESLFSRRDTR
jgi:glycosyltransferase involved in cell wall biosynthesis